MTKEQQEKGIKELALDMASYGYSSEAWGAANVKDKNKIAHRKLFLAEYLVKKGWRKAGDTISQDSIKAMKKAFDINDFCKHHCKNHKSKGGCKLTKGHCVPVDKNSSQ